MAYQPPLIGFKQLLNFGAYSIPDIGGWLFIASGIFMLLSVLIEKNIIKMKTKLAINSIFIVCAMWLVPACGQKGPEAIKLNKDNCDFCKMTIADKRFAAELITEKGRIYKFDDIKCMIGYSNENKQSNKTKYYVSDHSSPNALIQVENIIFLKGGNLESPMGGNIAGFSKPDDADKAQKTMNATRTSWNEIFKRQQ
jgi:copper chaperone NosL